MQKDMKVNYIYNLLYQIFNMFLPLITIPYLSRILRPSGIGMASYIDSIVAYFTLFAALSFTQYGQREISYEQDNVEHRSIIFWEILIFKAVISTIVLSLYILFVFFLVEADEQILYWVKILSILSVIFDVTWLFQGLEEFKKIVFRNFVVKMLWISFIFIFVKTKDDLVLYLVGQGCIDLIGALSLWSYLPKQLKTVELWKLRPFRNLKTIILLFIPAIAYQVYAVLDKTMIGIITQDVVQNGYYEQAMRIGRVSVTLLTAMGTVMMSRIGYHFQKRESEMINKLIYRSYRLVWFLGIPMCLGLMCVAPNFVPWFFGIGYEPVIPLLQISSILILSIALSNVTGVQYLLPTKRENQYNIAVVCGAVINFLLNILLIKYYQALGAAIASVIAESLISVLMIWFIRNEIAPIIIIKSSVHYVLAGIVMAMVLTVENVFFAASIINSFIMICTGMIVYFIVLALLRDDFFFYCYKSVMHIILKKQF